MNLLVGGTGFVGGHVVEYLFQQSEISKGTFRMGSHLKIMDLNGVQAMEADLLDHHSLHEAVEGCDTVYSMASPMPGADTEFERVNTEGMHNLLEVAQELGVKNFVHLSTLDVYGFAAGTISESTSLGPGNAYQSSKAAAERVLLEFAKRNPQPRVGIIRAARAVGPRDDSLTAPILRMMAAGTVVVPKSREMSFSHPKDIAQALYLAATGQARTGAVHLTKSFDATPEQLVRAIATGVHLQPKIRNEGFLSKTSLPPYAAEQLKASLRIGDQPSWKELGYAPQFDLQKTAADISEWYRKEPWATEAA